MGWPWIPAWLGIKSNVCSRYDCSEYRYAEPDGNVRRWCQAHADQWDAMQAAKGGAEVIPLFKADVVDGEEKETK